MPGYMKKKKKAPTKPKKIKRKSIDLRYFLDVKMQHLSERVNRWLQKSH
jgi:hypothetical protein